MRAYARGAFEAEPGVAYDFCVGRGDKYPHAFLKDWSGTLVVDAYSGYDASCRPLAQPELAHVTINHCLAMHPHRG